MEVSKNEHGHYRGLHIAIFNPFNGVVVKARAFDTYKTSVDLDGFIHAGIPEGYIVVAACMDECSTNLSKAAVAWFKGMGSREILNLGYRESFTFIGISGRSQPHEARAAGCEASVTQIFQVNVDFNAAEEPFLTTSRKLKMVRSCLANHRDKYEVEEVKEDHEDYETQVECDCCNKDVDPSKSAPIYFCKDCGYDLCHSCYQEDPTPEPEPLPSYDPAATAKFLKETAKVVLPPKDPSNYERRKFTEEEKIAKADHIFDIITGKKKPSFEERFRSKFKSKMEKSKDQNIAPWLNHEEKVNSKAARAKNEFKAKILALQSKVEK